MNAVPESLPLKAGEARRLECSIEEYYDDPCSVPSLSQSIATTLVTESPLHAWTVHPRFGANERERTKATNEGEIIHKLLLGKGSDVEIIHADNFRTKAAQIQRDNAIMEGRVPMLAKDYDGLVAAAETIRGNLSLYGYDLDGESEVPLEWAEAGEHGPVVCRGLLDHLKVSNGHIFDVKKIRRAHPTTVARHMTDYGYDIQHAAYMSAVSKLLPELVGRIRFTFLFMEIEPPFAILPAEPDGSMRELGSMRWNRAVFTWERCLRNNQWPSYSDRVVQIAPLPWVMNQEMGEQY